MSRRCTSPAVFSAFLRAQSFSRRDATAMGMRPFEFGDSQREAVCSRTDPLHDFRRS